MPPVVIAMVQSAKILPEAHFLFEKPGKKIIIYM